METNRKLITYLRKSLLLQDSNIDIDPEFNYTDEDLLDILEIKAKELGKTLDTIKSSDIPLVILLSKKEIYWRLATASAPFYDIRVEDAELSKGQRFNHYLSLIKELNSELEFLMSTGIHTEINVGEILLDSKFYTRRNLNLAEAPKIKVEVDNIYKDKVELSWSIDMINQRFVSYGIYVGTEPVIDEYGDSTISPNAKHIKDIFTIHKRKYRIEDLKPEQEYYIAIIVRELNGLAGFSQVKVKTLGDEDA